MSIFKDTFRKYVRNQISLREELIDIGNTDDNGVRSSRLKSKEVKLQDGTNATIDPGAFFSYSLNKQCVVRMTSLVDYVEDVNLDIGNLGEQSFQRLKGSSLSQNFILQGGILSDFARNTDRKATDKDGNPLTERKVRKVDQVRQSFRRPGLKTNLAYGDFAIGSDATSDGYGIVPMPGITDANIRTKSAYGSLREAKVTFEVHNQRQLEIMEMLYMRPGYMVLLEWGWCPYIKSSGTDAGKIVNELRLVENETNNKIYTNDITQQTVFNAINRLKESQDGNYDGLLAIVKNFGFQARDDGGFNCFTELISIGEVMESLKIPNVSVFKSGIGGTLHSKSGEGENRQLTIDSKYENTTYHHKGGSTTATNDRDHQINFTDFQNALSAGIFPNSNGLLGMIQSLNNYVTFNARVLNGTNSQRAREISDDDSLISQKLDNVMPELNDEVRDKDDFKTDYFENFDRSATSAGYGKEIEEGDGGEATTEIDRRKYLLDLLRFQSANIDIFIKKVLKISSDEELQDYIIFRGHKGTEGYKRVNEVQQSYIRWDALSILFNESLIPKDAKASTPFSIITDRIYYKSKDEKRFDPLLFCGITAYDNIQSNEIFDFSCDANVCILPNQFAPTTTADSDVVDFKQIESILGYIPNLSRIPVDYIIAKYEQNDEIYYKGNKIIMDKKGFVGTLLTETDKFRRIGNIFLNIDMLLNIAEKNADNDEYTLGNFINDVWGEVNKVCPNHNFVLTDDKESNLGFIIDLPVDNTELPLKDLHEFIPYSNKNILRNFEYTSNVPSAMTSTIAIQAQDPRSIQDIDGVTFAAFNRAIKNRILSTDITSNFEKTISNLESQESSFVYEQNKLKNRLIIYLDKFFLNLKAIANEQSTVGDGNIMGTLKSYQKNSAYFSTAYSQTSTFNSVIPLEFSATMDGISGIVIGNIFKIQKDRLPKAYAKTDIGFIVFNEEQKITAGGDWTTDISGKMIILPPKDKKPQILGISTEIPVDEDLKDYNESTKTVVENTEITAAQSKNGGTAVLIEGDEVFLKQVDLEGLGFRTTIFSGGIRENEIPQKFGFSVVRSTPSIFEKGDIINETDDTAIGLFNSWEVKDKFGIKGVNNFTDGTPGAATVVLGKIAEVKKIPFDNNQVKIYKSALSSYIKEEDLNHPEMKGGNKTILFSYEKIEIDEDGEKYYIIKGGLPTIDVVEERAAIGFPNQEGYVPPQNFISPKYIDISTRPGNGEFLGGQAPDGKPVLNSAEINKDKTPKELRNALVKPRRVRVTDTVNDKDIWFKINFYSTVDELFLNEWSIKGGYVRDYGADDSFSSSTKLSEYSATNDCWMRDDTLAATKDLATYASNII